MFYVGEVSNDGHTIAQALSPSGSDSTLIRLKVVPGASRTRVAGMLGDRLKVQVAAPPEAGKANKAVCNLLAQQLGIAKADVAVTAGAGQPTKTVLVAGLSPAVVVERLGRG